MTFTTGARESEFKLYIQCLLYWSIIASDKSRLRLNFVSFHQHGIRWGLSCIQLLRDYQRLDWYQVSYQIDACEILLSTNQNAALYHQFVNTRQISDIDFR